MGIKVTGRRGQSVQIRESPGLPSGKSKQSRVDEGQSTVEEIWETRPDRKVREAEGPGLCTVAGTNQKRYHQSHISGQFSGSLVEG